MAPKQKEWWMMIGDESGWPNLENEFKFKGQVTARDKARVRV